MLHPVECLVLEPIVLPVSTNLFRGMSVQRRYYVYSRIQSDVVYLMELKRYKTFATRGNPHCSVPTLSRQLVVVIVAAAAVAVVAIAVVVVVTVAAVEVAAVVADAVVVVATVVVVAAAVVAAVVVAAFVVAAFVVAVAVVVADVVHNVVVDVDSYSAAVAAKIWELVVLAEGVGA